jgi:hypothetical protein
MNKITKFAVLVDKYIFFSFYFAKTDFLLFIYMLLILLLFLLFVVVLRSMRVFTRVTDHLTGSI